MERKLELADIAGYLPYGLRVRISDEFIKRSHRPKYADRREFDPMYIKSVEFSYSDVYLSVTHESKEFSEEGLIEEFLPILRPMTDLTKPMTHPDINDGEEFVPIMELVKLLWDKKWVLETEVTSEEFINTPFYYHLGRSKVYVRFYNNQLVSYDDRGLLAFHGLTLPMIDLFNKLHFDYNNLIGQGLAIDINTIE